MTQTETTIDIEFPKPVPVTDISFFNGNPNDADAWEREARAKEYKLEIQRGDGAWESRDEQQLGVYLDFYYLFETYKREEAAGDRQFLCVTNVMQQEGNRLVKTGEHESTWKPGYDNRIRHIRLSVTKLTQRRPTGRNPLSGIRVYACPKDYEFRP
jgi:hypothetical protein